MPPIHHVDGHYSNGAKSVENMLDHPDDQSIVKQTIELQRQMLAKTKTDKVNHLIKHN